MNRNLEAWTLLKAQKKEAESTVSGLWLLVGTAGQDATVITATTSASQKPLIRPQSLSFLQYLMFPTRCLIGQN